MRTVPLGRVVILSLCPLKAHRTPWYDFTDKCIGNHPLNKLTNLLTMQALSVRRGPPPQLTHTRHTAQHSPNNILRKCSPVVTPAVAPLWSDPSKNGVKLVVWLHNVDWIDTISSEGYQRCMHRLHTDTCTIHTRRKTQNNTWTHSHINVLSLWLACWSRAKDWWGSRGEFSGSQHNREKYYQLIYPPELWVYCRLRGKKEEKITMVTYLYYSELMDNNCLPVSCSWPRQIKLGQERNPWHISCYVDMELWVLLIEWIQSEVRVNQPIWLCLHYGTIIYLKTLALAPFHEYQTSDIS